MEKSKVDKKFCLNKTTIFEIVYCALLASLAIVLEKTSLVLAPKIKFTLYGLPLMISGIVFGIKGGLLTGLVCGIVAQLTSPYGITITSPFWALAPIAWGSVSGIVYMTLKGKSDLIKISLTVIFASVFATLLNTFAMFCDVWLINDAYYTISSIIVALPTRIILMLVLIIPYISVLYAITRSLLPIVNNN